MLRRLTGPCHIQIDNPSRSRGRPVSVGIAAWEPTEAQRPNVPDRLSACPVCCRADFPEGERLSALLYPRFLDIAYVMAAWVHARCLDRCEPTDEPDPVPW